MQIDDVDPKKMHHRNAPDTERAAAHKVARSVTGRRREALQALAAKGGVATGEQIALASGLSILSIRPRLTELAEMELIEATDRRITNAWGNPEIVWEITEKGLRYVD